MNNGSAARRVLAITHPDGGTAGVFHGAANAARVILEEWSPAGGGAPQRALADYAGLVVLGGGQNVSERARFPYLDDELALIRTWLDSERPLLGVCLGAQLLAEAAGGSVVRCADPEIGWLTVERTAAGNEDPVLGFGAPVRTSYQWHSYAAQPPPRAAVLARSRACVQAFRVEEAWGVQFHPEVTPAIVADWIADWEADADAVAAQFNPAEARAAAARELPSWMAYGSELFARFLRRVGVP